MEHKVGRQHQNLHSLGFSRVSKRRKCTYFISKMEEHDNQRTIASLQGFQRKIVFVLLRLIIIIKMIARQQRTFQSTLDPAIAPRDSLSAKINLSVLERRQFSL